MLFIELDIQSTNRNAIFQKEAKKRIRHILFPEEFVFCLPILKNKHYVERIHRNRTVLHSNKNRIEGKLTVPATFMLSFKNQSDHCFSFRRFSNTKPTAARTAPAPKKIMPCTTSSFPVGEIPST